MSIKFSILILTYNRYAAVQACFDSLSHTMNRDDTRITIWDNGSTDGTQDYLWGMEVGSEENFHPPLILNSDENLGVAGGRAKLLEYGSDSEYVVFLDSDVIITDDSWLDILAAALEPENVGMVGPGGSYMAADWSGFLPGHPGPVDCVNGACQMFKREVLKAGVHLDLNYGKFWTEDSDFCFQIREAGYDVLCVPAPILHTPGESGDEDGLHQRNHDYFVSKWRGKGIARCEGGY